MFLQDLSALSASDKSYLVLANQVQHSTIAAHQACSGVVLVCCSLSEDHGWQIAETVVGIAVVRWAVRGAEPLPTDLFNTDFR